MHVLGINRWLVVQNLCSWSDDFSSQ